MIGVLLSHHSEAHSSCGAPVRQALMIQLLFLQTALFSRPFHFFSSASLGLFWEHSSPLLPAHLFLLTQLPHPPHLPPLPSPESGRPWCHHSPPGDNRYKGGLGGRGLRPLNAQRHWGESERKVPPPLLVRSSPPSSPPPRTMKTLSVWIRKERCAPAEGITVIKAVPPHLCTSIPLSTFFFPTYN